MSQSQRLTCWFSPRERAAIEKAADEREVYLNQIVREAVRAYLGISNRRSSPVKLVRDK